MLKLKLLALYSGLVLSWPIDGRSRPQHVAKYHPIVIIASCLMYIVYWRCIIYYTDLIIHNGMVSLKNIIKAFCVLWMINSIFERKSCVSLPWQRRCVQCVFSVCWRGGQTRWLVIVNQRNGYRRADDMFLQVAGLFLVRMRFPQEQLAYGDSLLKYVTLISFRSPYSELWFSSVVFFNATSAS